MENSQQFSSLQERLYQNERLAKIMEILRAKKYVSVKTLTEILNYSNATVNRDLNILEKKRLVKRSYGGVELTDSPDSLAIRYEKMKPSKVALAKKAAQLVCDGDVLFIDASTTTEYMAPYLTEKKDLTVISNNMALIRYLSQYSVCCVCLGGTVAEPPDMLCGDDTVKNAAGYYANKMFFSTGGISREGFISFGGTYGALHQTMMEHSSRVYYMADRDKIIPTPGRVKHLGEFHGVIVDFSIDAAVKEKCPDTEFYEI